MNKAVKLLENKLTAIYTNATKKLDSILSNIDLDSYTDDDIDSVVLEIQKYKNEIVKEIEKAGNNASNEISKSSLQLYKRSYLQSLNDFDTKIGTSLNWGLPSNSEFESLLAEEINVYDRKASANLSDRNVISRRFDNALISVVVAKIALDKINKEITDKIARRAWNDSIRLARTQSTGIVNGSRFKTYKEAQKMGIRGLKKWVSTYDGRTRVTHRHLQGQKEELNDYFENGLMYPRDPRGNSAEVVNCRCTIVYVMDGTQEYDYSKSFGEPDFDISEILEEMEWD